MTRMACLAVLAAAALVAGCESVSYYRQAIGGHLDLLQRAQPLEQLLADPATPPALREQLGRARAIRAYASSALALPDNASYTRYAELGRPYAVWNVVAAPEFSVVPVPQCFPVAGCVSYRGFFDEAAARAHAETLRASGLDVHVAGVPAYSTLGWFDDPLLSTFISYTDTQLARLVFHELAHQLLYQRGDTAFNESFAAAVEEEGVRRWLESQGRAAELAAFREAQARRRAFGGQIELARNRLATIYRGPEAPDEMRKSKSEEFSRLRAAYPKLVPADANNAYLASVSAYAQLLPEFERLLAEAGGDLPRFYAAARAFGEARTAAGPPSSGTPAARTGG